MQITRKCPLTGCLNTLDIHVTQAQLDDYRAGTHLQHAFPRLSSSHREFIKTGITDEAWDAMFSDEEED